VGGVGVDGHEGVMPVQESLSAVSVSILSPPTRPSTAFSSPSSVRSSFPFPSSPLLFARIRLQGMVGIALVVVIVVVSLRILKELFRVCARALGLSFRVGVGLLSPLEVRKGGFLADSLGKVGVVGFNIPAVSVTVKGFSICAGPMGLIVEIVDIGYLDG
jgi:hypothetical protein